MTNQLAIAILVGCAIACLIFAFHSPFAHAHPYRFACPDGTLVTTPTACQHSEAHYGNIKH